LIYIVDRFCCRNTSSLWTVKTNCSTKV